MADVIPTDPSEIDRPITVELDGREYRIRLVYKARINGGSWYADLATADGDPLLTGRRLCPGRRLTADLTDDRLPPGELIAIGRDPYRRHDLGGDLKLVYIPESEVPVSTASTVTVT